MRRAGAQRPPVLSELLLQPAFDPGGDAARRLGQSRVLLVGVGGLGSPAALGLVAAGVGSIVIVDFDRVETSNLQRQVLFRTSDAGHPKVDAARARLRHLAPGVHVDVVREPLSVANAATLIEGVDLVLDGTDNFATRYLVNDACVLAHRPNVFGSVARFDGQVAVFAAPGGPCYRCLHPEPPPDGLIENCAEGGVLGVLPGVVGALQVVEAVKVLTGIGLPLIGRMLLYDALRMRARDITLPRDPMCPVCGDAPTIRELVAATVVCGAADDTVMAPATLAEWRRAGVSHLLVDVREPWEQAEGVIDGARLLPIGAIGRQARLFEAGVPIVVYCRTGGRSGRAAALLRSFGLDARSLSGGIEAWHRGAH